MYGVHATSCLLAGCIVESDIGNIVVTSSQIVGGNQLIAATGSLGADVFQNNGGVPGAPIGSLTLLGSLTITYLGRSADSQLGFILVPTHFVQLHGRIQLTYAGKSVDS